MREENCQRWENSGGAEPGGAGPEVCRSAVSSPAQSNTSRQAQSGIAKLCGMGMLTS